MQDTIKVTFLEHASTPDPLRTLYGAFRVDYSALTPQEIQLRIEAEKITPEAMLEFINARFETGHASPLQEVYFGFGISGVSRAFSHQFVRHHNGIDFEQQSQRYVTFKDGRFPYTIPPTVHDAPAPSLDEIEEHPGAYNIFNEAMRDASKHYASLIALGIPGEDARFVLPNAANTNFQVTVNFLELQHIADLRLCTRAQWEFRKVMAKMRGEVRRRYPWLGDQLGPKCMAFRTGYCDEAKADWAACPLSTKRPHKSDVIPA